jgi:hypothetical protein
VEAGPRAPRIVPGLVMLPLALLLLWKAWWLRYPDLAWSYPFISFDGYQWILEGLHLGGQDVTTWGRNPGFPAIIALLDDAYAAHLLPLVHVVLLAVFLFLCFRLAGFHASKGAAALAVLIIGFGYSTQAFFDYVLADPWAITFLTAALVSLEDAPSRPARVLAAAFFAALSFLCQYAIAFALPGLALFVWFRVLSPAGNRRAWLWVSLGAALGVVLVAPIFVYKWKRYGDPLWSAVVQFPLIRPHLFGLPTYSVAALEFLGIPAALAAAVGLVSALRNPGRHLLPLLVQLGFGAFWILLYVWLDPRFLLYLLPSGAVFLALGLDRLDVPAALASPKGITRRLISVLGLVVALLLAGFPRDNPFDISRLPVTPRTALVFGTRMITQWPGDLAIDWSPRIRAERVERRQLAAAAFWADHWRTSRTLALENRDLAADDLLLFRDIAERRLGPHFRISSCSAAPLESIERWKREISLRRSLRECGAPADLTLRERPDSGGGEVIGAGSRLLLIRSAP